MLLELGRQLRRKGLTIASPVGAELEHDGALELVNLRPARLELCVVKGLPAVHEGTGRIGLCCFTSSGHALIVKPASPPLVLRPGTDCCRPQTADN